MQASSDTGSEARAGTVSSAQREWLAKLTVVQAKAS